MAAEDIVSESIIKLWYVMKDKKLDSPIALLMTIIKNKSLDYLKHQIIANSAIVNIEGRHNRELNIRISSLEACNPEELFSSEIMDIISRVLDKLPKQTRVIFTESRFDNLSAKDIALNHDLSVKSVEYHITKALKLLRLELVDYLPNIALVAFVNDILGGLNSDPI